MRREAGFTLIEIICVLAIVGILALLALPFAPHGTSRARLEAYAMAMAALLTSDRNAAIRGQRRVTASLSLEKRSIKSGYSSNIVQVPADIAFDALLAQRCGGRPSATTIDFFPSGMSCGGVIGLRRPGAGFQVRVNWLTGGVEVVPTDKPQS